MNIRGYNHSNNNDKILIRLFQFWLHGVGRELDTPVREKTKKILIFLTVAYVCTKRLHMESSLVPRIPKRVWIAQCCCDRVELFATIISLPGCDATTTRWIILIVRQSQPREPAKHTFITRYKFHDLLTITLHVLLEVDENKSIVKVSRVSYS